MGAGAPANAAPRFPSPLIKPDVPISGIRLSEWFHRRLTYARLWDLVAVKRPTIRTPVLLRTGECLARTPCAAFSESSVPDHTRAHPLPDTLDSSSLSRSTAASLLFSGSASDRPPPKALRSAYPTVPPPSA